jgi:hypothetical protein
MKKKIDKKEVIKAVKRTEIKREVIDGDYIKITYDDGSSETMIR